MKSPIVFHSLKAFCVGFFGVAGAVLGALVVFVGIGSLFYLSEEDSLSSHVTLVADDKGERKQLGSDAPVILRLNVKGEIGRDGLKAGKVENLLLKSRENEFKEGRVKGILLAINCPGGDATDTDIIYRELKQYKERYNVPIYAFVDGMCASGGYYIACAADKIYASDVSLIGSIGVIAWPPFFNVADLMQKLGVKSMTLSAGTGKDEMNPVRAWKEDEHKNYEALLQAFYKSFVGVVCENRPHVEHNRLVEEFGAKVVPAAQAAQFGLIDSAGYSYSKTLKELALAAGMDENTAYQVVTLESQEWLKKLFSEKSFIFSGKIRHVVELPKELSTSSDFPMKYLYQH